METGTEANIKQVKFYNCGYCTNKINHMYKGIKKGKVDFYARVMLIEHSKYGFILVDTGYSERIYENGIMSKFYNQLNPTKVESYNSIIFQLKKDGIQSNQIKTIILTHLHPDHIGGVYDFPNAKLIMSLESQKLISTAKFKDLMFKNMISEKVNHQISGIQLIEESPLEDFMGMDLYGDDSIWIISLEGHAKGQLGVYLPKEKLFYVADAIWGTEYLNMDMRFIVKHVQYNYDDYFTTIKKIKRLKDIQVISTHGNEEYKYE